MVYNDNKHTFEPEPSDKPTPLLLQTYLNNDRWLLGSMEMETVIKQYAGRSMSNDKIANCPA